MENTEGTLSIAVRMPKDVRDRVFRSAKENRRSMNSQIIVLLEQALPDSEKAETAATVPAQ